MANDSLERNTASSWTEPVSIESSGSKEEYLETMWRLFGQPSGWYRYSNTNLSCDRNFDKQIVALHMQLRNKGKDCAKYDEMYHAKSVLWISEITSSPKPLQYKENRTYSSVPCTEVSSLQCYPALQLLHSSEEPWQKLHFVYLGKNCILFWEAVQLIDNSSSWTHWRISTTHFDVYGLISWYQLLSIGTLLYYIYICFSFYYCRYGWFPPGFNKASLQVPDSRMKLLVSLVLLDWKFQNSNLSCFWLKERQNKNTSCDKYAR